MGTVLKLDLNTFKTLLKLEIMLDKFEAKVRYEAIDQVSGRVKKMNETYLIEAVNFSDAETRITAELEKLISGEFLVTGIRKGNYAEVFFNDNGDRWFRSKIAFVMVDEQAGREKKVAQYVLVEANDVKEAYDNIQEAMKGMTVDFDIVNVSDSNIVDVILLNDGSDMD